MCSTPEKCSCKMFIFKIAICSLVLCAGVVDGFNLDTQNYAKFGGHSESMFGFSVATHRLRSDSWVLIGAPKAQSQQPNVERGGSVFRCRIDQDNNCEEVPFDTKGSNVDQNKIEIDSKSNQWFGATVHSAGENGPIVACAPRYVYYGTKGDRRDPVGTCYVSSPDFRNYSEYSPCRTRYFGYHRQGSCQAGFSAALTNDGHRLFLGAPGSYYWQGQIFSIDANAKFPFSPGLFTNGAFGSGQVSQQPLEKRPAVVSTNEGVALEDDSYMGYSMAVGDFTGDGEQGVAVGKPRGSRLLGQINLFTWNLTNYQNISLAEYGHQIGTYFGYSIAAGDFDGDKTDDLIVGAPLHVEPNNEGKYEVGRVYVIYQGREASKFRRFNTIDGFKSKSRFGLSVATLGDINIDGYADFAVGAPYGGPNERGAVYIYHGAKSLNEAKYSQVIYAEDVSHGLPIKTFGFSLSGGVDLDSNDYPDMVVGAYDSDTAFFFRARPVVKIESQVDFLNRNKKIVLEEKNCTLRNGGKVPCTRVKICMKFHGKNVPSAIELDVEYVLDGKKTPPRMFFLTKEESTSMKENIRLRQGQDMTCREKMVYIQSDIKDKLTPLEFEVKYAMKEAQSLYLNRPRDPRIPVTPILDPNHKQTNKDSLTIHKNCGPDNICIPNLKLEVKSNVESFLQGSKDKLEFDVVVHNLGEDSFESSFDMHLPEGILFNKIRQGGHTEVRILCSAPENNTVICDIGNPLPANKIVRFTVLLDTAQHREGMRPTYDFLMTVNSTNPETPDTMFDNRFEKSIPIWVNSQLELSGTSKPAEVHYNASVFSSEKITKESDIGPQVIHLYSIKNNGPSSFNEAEVVFFWPYATLGGEDLLYLVEQPHILGNMKCEVAEANYRGYELEVRKKSIWDQLGISPSEFASLTQAGGLVIMEGPGTHGSTPKDIKHTNRNEAEERQQVTSSGSSGLAAGSGSGTVVHVSKDTGSGSKVSETHVAEGWSQNGTTYSKDFQGGRVHVTQTSHTSSSSSSSGGGGGSSGGYQSGYSGSSSSSSSSSSRGGSASGVYQGHSGTGSGLQGSDTIVYTSSGNKPSEAAISFTSGSSGTATASSSSSSTSSAGGYLDSTSYIEGRRSGQQFNASDGGHTTYQSGTYFQRPNKTNININRHFDWNSASVSNHTTSGRPSASSADVYQQNRDFYAERQREQEERRIHEQEARRQEEKLRRQQEERRVAEEHHRIMLEQRRVEEERIRVEEQRRLAASATVVSSGRRRPDEEARIRAEEEARRIEQQRRDEEYRQQLEEYRRRQEEYNRNYGIATATVSSGSVSSHGTQTQTQTQTHQQSGHSGQSAQDFNYSEEIYNGSEEDYQDLNQEGRHSQSHGAGYNFSQASHGGAHQGTYGSSSGGWAESAAAGGGFRTTGIDLGILGTGGSTSGSSGTSAHADNTGASHGVHYSSSSSGHGAQTGGYGHQSAHGAQSGSTHYESHSESSWSSSGRGTGGMSTHYQGRDNVATDRPNYDQRFMGRKKRDTEEKDIRDFMQCQSSKCLTIRCTVGPLLKDHAALIALRSRVNVRTLRNITTSQSISFSSMMLARIDKLPYIGRPVNRTVHSHEIFTTIAAPQPDTKTDIVPLWVIVLSAVGGTIVLLLLIYLLHKLGFFKRNRPSDAPERQPLNRNAYYNGDQAL